MKKSVIFFIILVIIFISGGCSHPFSQKGVSASVVQSIRVRCESTNSVVTRKFTDPAKIRLVLLCIRKLGPDFPAGKNVEALDGKTMHITLVCADGSATTYRLKNNLYIQKNDSPWRQINLDNATGFYQLIMELADDSPEDPLAHRPEDAPSQRVYFPAIRGVRTAGKS